MRASHLIPFVLSSVAATTAVAQSPELGTEAVGWPGFFDSPIHEEETPGGGGTETWAARDRFKVSFHDGMNFYPVLGPDFPANLPFGWKTSSVTLGGHELVGSNRSTWHDEDRFEYRLGAVVEAYDVRDDGVEQTFVITARGSSTGPLVVRGRVATALRCGDSDAEHRALEFVDHRGTPILSYGAATVVDACGVRYPMTTARVGEEIVLSLPAHDVESARFPLVVDPLLSPIPLTSSANPIEGAAVLHDEVYDRLLVSGSRAVSASDRDISTVSFANDFTSPVTVFSTMNPIDTRSPSMAFVGGVQFWILVFEAYTGELGIHVHFQGPITQSSAWGLLPRPPGTSMRRPIVGGTDAGSSSTRVVIVSEIENNTTGADTNQTGVRVQLFEVLDASMPYAASLFGGASIDYARPTVNQISDDAAAEWVAVYQAFDHATPGDDWDLRMLKMTAAQILTIGYTTVHLGQTLDGSKHNVAPQIAGSRGRYLVSYCSLPNFGPPSVMAGPEIRASLLESIGQSPFFAVSDDFQLRQAATNLSNVGLAYDHETCANWASVSQFASPLFGSRKIHVQRVNEAGPIESLDHGPGGFSVASGYGVTFDATNGRFPIVYTEPSDTLLRGVILTPPTLVAPFVYGTNCGTGVPWFASIGADGAALSGNEHFRITLSGGNNPSVLLASVGQASLPLDFAGFTFCTALVDLGPGFIGSAPGATDTSFTSVLDLPIPIDFAGSVYFQWAFLAPGLNVNGLGFSDGMRITVVQ